MPTFDGGHYFLTAFMPIATQPVKDGATITSPVHALRKELAKLPSSPTFAVTTDEQSPFSRNALCHFARFVIIDDVAYNGRDASDPLVDALRQAVGRIVNPVIAQPQDHLKRPYLLLAMDFDAADGSDASRDAFLQGLWADMSPELDAILSFCVGFGAQPASAARFARFIADCQVETTMPFNDYYIDPPALPSWTPGPALLVVGGLAVLAALFGVLTLALAPGWSILGGSSTGLLRVGVVLLIVGLVVLVPVGWSALKSLRAAGEAPFPPGPTLPEVLKALYLQQAFTRFAIDNQGVAPATLQTNFAAFVATTQPTNLAEPTQAPGGY
jgi:hypothetical protein